MTVTAVLQSVNKAIGAVVGGGVIALLVGLHVIPAGVGNTLLSVLGAAAAVLGAFLAPTNKPVPTGGPAAEDVTEAEAYDLDPQPAVVDDDAEQLIDGGTFIRHPSPGPKHAKD